MSRINAEYMALIKFEDKPSTKTPWNAENVNHNFDELDKKIISGEDGGASLLDSTDLNNVTSTGFYYVSNATNVPSDVTSGYLLVIRNTSSTNYLTQLYFKEGASDTFWFRCKSGNFGRWVAIKGTFL